MKGQPSKHSLCDSFFVYKVKLCKSLLYPTIIDEMSSNTINRINKKKNRTEIQRGDLFYNSYIKEYCLESQTMHFPLIYFLFIKELPHFLAVFYIKKIQKFCLEYVEQLNRKARAVIGYQYLNKRSMISSLTTEFHSNFKTN